MAWRGGPGLFAEGDAHADGLGSGLSPAVSKVGLLQQKAELSYKGVVWMQAQVLLGAKGWGSSHPVLPGGEFSRSGQLHLAGTVSWARQGGQHTVLNVRVHLWAVVETARAEMSFPWGFSSAHLRPLCASQSSDGNSGSSGSCAKVGREW